MNYISDRPSKVVLKGNITLISDGMKGPLCVVCLHYHATSQRATDNPPVFVAACQSLRDSDRSSALHVMSSTRDQCSLLSMRRRNGDVELCTHKTSVKQILKIALIAILEGCNSAERWGEARGE